MYDISMKRYSRLTFISLTVLLLCYSLFIEPNWLEVTYHRVDFKLAKNKVRIAHVTDLHSSEVGTIEKALLNAIKDNKPDVILITGDIATPGGTRNGYLKLLKSFQAPLGVFFVPGNWETWSPVPDLDDLLKEAGIHNLKNKVKKIKKKFWLVGFDDEPTGTPKTTQLANIPEEAVIAGMFHSPSFIKKVKGRINFAFAGHSHGGQVRLPFLGSLWTPEGTGKFESGWFELETTKLFVSRGTGNSILPIRFNCRPELAIIDLSY